MKIRNLIYILHCAAFSMVYPIERKRSIDSQKKSETKTYYEFGNNKDSIQETSELYGPLLESHDWMEDIFEKSFMDYSLSMAYPNMEPSPSSSLPSLMSIAPILQEIVPTTSSFPAKIPTGFPNNPSTLYPPTILPTRKPNVHPTTSSTNINNEMNISSPFLDLCNGFNTTDYDMDLAKTIPFSFYYEAETMTYSEEFIPKTVQITQDIVMEFMCTIRPNIQKTRKLRIVGMSSIEPDNIYSRCIPKVSDVNLCYIVESNLLFGVIDEKDIEMVKADIIEVMREKINLEAYKERNLLSVVNITFLGTDLPTTFVKSLQFSPSSLYSGKNVILVSSVPFLGVVLFLLCIAIYKGIRRRNRSVILLNQSHHDPCSQEAEEQGLNTSYSENSIEGEFLTFISLAQEIS